MQENPSILEIIDTRRWRRAVFTSFTLSLTYFEAYVLPRLRAQGCGIIDIYVDSLGYRDSLMEQRSRHVGREYKIHPVNIATGIFHPKLVYLWAEESNDDLLLVGSGNLTHSGHGGNLEVFDILRPHLHATAFGEASAFFDKLAQRPRQFTSGSDVLQALHRRTEALSTTFKNAQSVHFIHSLDEPALVQLVRHVGGRTVRELVVMSPYHNPEGSAVEQLVVATRPALLSVSIDTGAVTSPFPFKKTGTWGCSVKAVTPLDSGKRNGRARFGHAKWYEFRLDDCAIALTGSFNATNESFASCNNVECGVIRCLDEASPMWMDTEPLDFAKQTFPRAGSAGLWLATASLDRRQLIGHILGYVSLAPSSWEFSLKTADQDLMTGMSVEVAIDGTFAITLRESINLTNDEGLQIHLTDGTISARGWVLLPQILNIAPERRFILALIGESESGTQSAQGMTELLSIMKSELSVFSSQVSLIKETGARKSSPPEADAVPPTDWTAAARDIITERPGASTSKDRLLTLLAGGQRGAVMLEAFGEMLLGPQFSRKQDAGAGQQPRSSPSKRQRILRLVPETEAEEQEVEAQSSALANMLAQFEDVVEGVRGRLKDNLWSVRGDAELTAAVMYNLARIERMSLHVMLGVYAGPLNDLRAARYRLGEWLHKTVDLDLDDAALALLLPDIAGCAAVLASSWSEAEDDFVQATAAGRHPCRSSRVVQYIEAAFNGEPLIDLVLSCADSWLDTQIGFELIDADVESALDKFSFLLARPTPRALVARFLLEKPKNPLAASWNPLPERVIALLCQAAKVDPARRKAYYGCVNVKSIQSCTLCHQSLRPVVAGAARRPDPTLLADLKLFSVAKCPNCHGPLISTAAFAK